METWTYIQTDMVQALSYLPAGIGVGALLSVVTMYRNRKKACAGKKAVLYGTMGVYLTAVLYLTIFSREAGSRDMVQLAFLETWNGSPRSVAYLLENIVLFLPGGICLPLLSGRFQKLFWCGAAGLLGSLVIESVQWITKTGYFQTDDLVMNTFGAVLGGLIGRWICRIWKNDRKNAENQV